MSKDPHPPTNNHIPEHRTLDKEIHRRNMDYIKLCPLGGDLEVPKCTKDQPSPPRQSASNQHPAQPATRRPVDKALQHELSKARFVSDDLADHMFGHLVSLDLAKDILKAFISRGDIQVFQGKVCYNTKNSKSVLAPTSPAIEDALQRAYVDAKEHACIHPRSRELEDESFQAGENQSKGVGEQKGKAKERKVSYTWRWKDFPLKVHEDELVDFLNQITDDAFDIAKPYLGAGACRHNRFATPKDKKHAVPLAYEVDNEDMRPDFLLLPIEAFSNDMTTVDQKYVNFTALRMVGESKRTDFKGGLEQVQRYARGLRKAQPWAHFVTAMTVTKQHAALLRGEGSGTECLELRLTSGLGCIEFIRILLGLALADEKDLGQNPDVELSQKRIVCRSGILNRTAESDTLAASLEGNTSSSARVHAGSDEQFDHPLPSSLRSQGSSNPHTSILSSESSVNPSSASNLKRSHDMVDYPASEQGDMNNPKRQKLAHTECIAFVPIKVYGYICLGILFTSGSIRGRGTTVFIVYSLEPDPQPGGLDHKHKLLALKMSWQDVARVENQDRILEKLKELEESNPDLNIVVPYRVSRKAKLPLTTLEGIRGFRKEDLSGFQVENRELTISVSKLKRPVKFFWGPHDFVRGLQGALLGHEYLVQNGILHRDVSENNVVLALRPLGEERGYLIDFDMAISQEQEDESQVTEDGRYNMQNDYERIMKSASPIPADESKPLKALRTGTTPYMSFNVLRGGKHTQYDDVESFLYILVLFFFGYAGPLSKEELLAADTQGFAHSVGSGRRLPHIRRWPNRFLDWTGGDTASTANDKDASLCNNKGGAAFVRSVDVKDCMANNWPEEELKRAITMLLAKSWQMFINSRRSRSGLPLEHTKVRHREFIELLDEWLKDFGEFEEKHSQCPFSIAQ